MINRRALLAAVAIALAAGAGALFWLNKGPSPREQARQALLQLALPDLAGQTQALKQWQGKVLVVNYWATWCPPCKAEMPGFSRLQEKYRGKGVQFVGISTDSPEKVAEYVQNAPVSYTLLLGNDDLLWGVADLGNPSQVLPFTLIFDRDGQINSTQAGRFFEADLDRRLEKLVGGGP